METTPRIDEIFSLVSKVCREFDDVTLSRKLLHGGAVATWNARLPTVDSRVGTQYLHTVMTVRPDVRMYTGWQWQSLDILSFAHSWHIKAEQW